MEYNDDFRRQLFRAIDVLTAQRYNNPIKEVEADAKAQGKAGARSKAYVIICENCGKEAKKGSRSARTCSDNCRKTLSLQAIEARQFIESHMEDIVGYLQSVIKA